MDDRPDDVVMLRTGQVEWRINGLDVRMDAEPALALAYKALLALGWSPDQQRGLRVDEVVQVMPDERRLRDEMERLRANGRAATTAIVQRPALLGPWTLPDSTAATGTPSATRQRRFAKETAVAKTTTTTPARKQTSRPAEKVSDDPGIDKQLFADPRDQLQYEVMHAYLMTVPLSQRQQWPMGEYILLDSFMADIDNNQGGALSRMQIVLAVVDVVSSRMNDINSRRPRPLREGGGDDGRAIITRTDGAVAWRANVSHGTPAARRIMWWRTTSGALELARLSTHDDIDIPER